MAGPDHLAPGETSSITTRLETAGKTGLVKETVEVHSNDPRRPSVRLIVEAAVMGDAAAILPSLPAVEVLSPPSVQK